MLGYELSGKKAKFLNFRHTGASHIAQRGRVARHLLAIVKMMGDTSVATVNRHYFNLEDDVMQEIIDGWAVLYVEVFASDLEPVALILRRATMMRPLWRSSRRRAARVSERRVLPPALSARTPFALL